MSRPGGPAVVLLVENESVPTDRRVWNHARLLHDAGYRVTVVCPVGEGRDTETDVELDGIRIRRFPLRRASGGLVPFITEYLAALWRMAWIVARLPGPVAVVQSANPPDFLFLVGLLAKLRWRSRLLFDHHDLVPELFQTRFGPRSPILHLVQAAERLNFRLADAVISTNESYRTIAIDRGRVDPGRVRVVRNARDRATFRRGEPDPELRRGRPHLAVYVGMMGPQDGADVAVRVAAHYRHTLKRNDLTFAMVGDGDAVPACRRLACQLGVDDMVDFVGWKTREEVLSYLSTADVGLATDPPGPLNDRSTMIKVIEYVTVGLPVVSFDLPESMVTAGEAALYSPGGDIAGMAENLTRLVDDPGLRAKLSSVAEEQTEGPLSWEASAAALLDTYRELTARG